VIEKWESFVGVEELVNQCANFDPTTLLDDYGDDTQLVYVRESAKRAKIRSEEIERQFTYLVRKAELVK
jgi:hypothetical protein